MRFLTLLQRIRRPSFETRMWGTAPALPRRVPSAGQGSRARLPAKGAGSGPGARGGAPELLGKSELSPACECGYCNGVRTRKGSVRTLWGTETRTGGARALVWHYDEKPLGQGGALAKAGTQRGVANDGHVSHGLERGLLDGRVPRPHPTGAQGQDLRHAAVRAGAQHRVCEEEPSCMLICSVAVCLEVPV